MSELSMTLPQSFVEALGRRHNGDQSKTHTERAKGLYLMELLYKTYKKYSKKLKLLDIEWEEKNIESFFMQPVWYNAHAKRKRYENKIKESRKRMFILLTTFDGNGGQEYSEFGCIGADETYEDFKQKYANVGSHE